MGSVCICSVLFFFKQKTAYEMRISDWSSDVCSSDLIEAIDRSCSQNLDHLPVAIIAALQLAAKTFQRWWQGQLLERRPVPQRPRLLRQNRHVMPGIIDGLLATAAAIVLGNDIVALTDDDAVGRSEERRVGKECVSTCGSRLWRDH